MGANKIISTKNLTSSIKTILLLFNKNIRFIKYSVIGVTGASLDFILFNLLINQIGLYYQYANIISVCAGITNNFFLNAFFNFKITTKLIKRYVSFFMIGLFGLLLSALLLFIFIERLHFEIIFTKAIIIVVVAIIQYFLNVKLTFKKGQQCI